MQNRLHVYWKRLRFGRYEILALAIITIAIVLRLILLANSWPKISSEEGTFGLEAMHIAYRGEFPIFMYGQNYMGVLESYLGAILFHLFGVSFFSLRLGMLIFFAFFLISIYSLTKLLYSPHMALITLVVLSVGSASILKPQMMVLGGAIETLLFGTLLMLLATWLSLSSGQEMSSRKKWQRIAGFAAWGCCAGLGIWSHLLVAPFVLVSGLLLLLFCHREVLTLAPLALLAGLVIGLLPLINYNLTATPGHDTYATFLWLYNSERTSGAISVPHLLRRELSGTFLYSLPLATGMYTQCTAAVMPYFSATPSPIGCMLAQGGWSLGFLTLLTIATCMAVGGLWKLRKLHPTRLINWPAEDRHMAIVYVAQLMLLLSAAITLFLFAHSPNAALRPWSTRYLVGLFVATPALLWPLGNGISSGIATFSNKMPHIHLMILFRRIILVLLVFLFAVEMLYTTIEIPLNKTSNTQDETITQYLISTKATHIYSDYWQCDRFIFLTQEKIICAVVNGNMSAGMTRYRSYYTIVHADPKAAYVFQQNSTYERNFDQKIAQSNQKFQKIVLAGYVVYRPEN
jgi:Dolichyl-phosphate-mannose-protein mannosyltransferase